MSTKSESPIDLDVNNNELLNHNSDTTSSQADSTSENDLIFSASNSSLKRNGVLLRNDKKDFNDINKQTSSSDENLAESSIYDLIENDKSKETSSKKSGERTRNAKRSGLVFGSDDNQIENNIAKLELEDDDEDDHFLDTNDSIKPDEFEDFKLEQKEFDENEKIEVEDPIVDEETNDEESNLPIEMNDEWQSKSRHVFILSEAGKPIYSLHGNEVQLITFMGLLQALVSIVECDNENKLKYVLAGDHKVVFLHRSHLIFVCVSNESDKCVEQLELELNYVYNQILSVVTLSLVEKVFARYNNYDLRNKLTGTEKLLTNIIYRFNNDFGMLLNCVNSFPLQFEIRDQIARTIAQQISPFRYVLFGLLLYDNRLVALIRPKTKNIHPVDVHLIVNVVTGLDTPKSAEFTWYPICLPNFNSSGMMYAYISHLDEQCKTCLILLTGLCDEDQSFELNECRKRIQQKLQTQSINQILNMKYVDASLRLDQIGVPELKHFLFKDNKIFQYFVSEYGLPYSASKEQQQRIFNIYQSLYHKLHNPTNNLKIIYMQQKYETILGWMTSSFEIYATFSSLVTKDIAVRAVNKLLEFTQKNKTKIFLSSMPTLQR